MLNNGSVLANNENDTSVNLLSDEIPKEVEKYSK